MKPKIAVGVPRVSTLEPPKSQDIRVELKFTYSAPAGLFNTKRSKLGFALKILSASSVTIFIVLACLIVATHQYGDGFGEILKPMFINLLKRFLS
jgi:hypothetical protein